MPNPFQRRGSSYLSAEWKVWTIGLLGQLALEPEDAPGQTLALIGDIGSGKTTAIEAYRERIQKARSQDVFPLIKADEMSEDDWPTLHRRVYVELVAALSITLHDKVVKELKLSARVGQLHLAKHDVFAIIRGMIRAAEQSGRRVHLLIDEGQAPAEHFEGQDDPAQLVAWFEELKSVAEAMSSGGGCMVITTTTSPWASVPRKAQDRFVALRASAPEAHEIQAFIDEGMKHTKGHAPSKASSKLGTAIKEDYPDLITIRELHDLLYQMWDKASRAGAPMLGREHLP